MKVPCRDLSGCQCQSALNIPPGWQWEADISEFLRFVAKCEKHTHLFATIYSGYGIFQNRNQKVLFNNLSREKSFILIDFLSLVCKTSQSLSRASMKLNQVFSLLLCALSSRTINYLFTGIVFLQGGKYYMSVSVPFLYRGEPTLPTHISPTGETGKVMYVSTGACCYLTL